MAPVCLELNRRADQFETIICDTGQHREMSRQILSLFDVVPNEELSIMRPNQTLFHVTSAVLHAFETLLEKHRPDVLLVQGDTTSAMAAALAGYYLKCKVGHVEAGLRTHAKYSPFPEEVNRRIITQVADYNFAPTEPARANLLAEGVPAANIWLTGNTVVDALQHVLPALRSHKTDEILDGLVPGLSRKKCVLITCHRRESFGHDLQQICSAIRSLAERMPDHELVYPVHLNPNVQKTVQAELASRPNIHLIPPQAYLPFLTLMNHSVMILTDSGGIQEEAGTLRKPILILRRHTERMEAVNAGYAWLVGAEPAAILERAEWVMKRLAEGANFFEQPNPFGDGRASQHIVDILQN